MARRDDAPLRPALRAPWPKTTVEVAPDKDATITARARDVTERALATGSRSLPNRVAEQARSRTGPSS
jgi:hypothetical protein